MNFKPFKYFYQKNKFVAKSSNKWPKVITVDKNIIKILSESTYENFPNALKEVIINSYDALATEVKIEVDLKNETITIWDNGNGMDEEDYDFYLRIAGKKREVKEYNKQERKKIGQFGVGFLAVFPFFKNYAIESKKAGETDCMHAEIPCHLYFDQYNRFIQISDIKISGGRKKENVLRNDHYTKITLTGFATITKEFFNPKSEFKVSKHSIKNKDYFSVVNKLKWLLSEDLPIEFEENYFNTFFTNYSSRLPFKVLYQNELLFRHVYAKTFILEEHKRPFSQIGKIKFQYFISTDKKPIHPNEGRYLKIRNLNVGVGDRENFLGKE
ncbi:MAG TPA: ATP-binding protein, partial [Bacteroidia bacterium]|nr:ATP-binding protein [Bacteroidia bacterium]